MSSHMTHLFDLRDRVALVTGGNGGLGLGMALGLAGAGASVIIAARRQDKADAALQRLREINDSCIFVRLDVSSEESCRIATRTVMERFGRLDILVNNAGATVRKLPQDLSELDWQTVIDTNLTGAFRCAQAAFPFMQAQGRGKIINIASMYAIFDRRRAFHDGSRWTPLRLPRSRATWWMAAGSRRGMSICWKSSGGA